MVLSLTGFSVAALLSLRQELPRPLALHRLWTIIAETHWEWLGSWRRGFGTLLSYALARRVPAEARLGLRLIYAGGHWKYFLGGPTCTYCAAGAVVLSIGKRT